MSELGKRPSNFLLEDCFICGAAPAVVWVYPIPHHPSSSLYPHRFISGRCFDCHQDWIKNWTKASPGLVFILNLGEARSVDRIIEIMTS